MLGILKSTMKYTVDSFDQTTAATDVVVIRHRDGTLHSSPFHVRFGRFKVVRPGDKCVQVEINGEVTAAVMKLGGDGLARWLKPVRSAKSDGTVGRVSSNASSEGIESPVCSPNLMPAMAPGLEAMHLNPTDAQLCSECQAVRDAEEEVSLEEAAKYKDLIASMADSSNTPVLTGNLFPESRPRGHSLALSGQLSGESPLATGAPHHGLKLSKMASVDGFMESFGTPPSAAKLPPPATDAGASDDDAKAQSPVTYRPPHPDMVDEFDRTPERTPAEFSEGHTGFGSDPPGEAQALDDEEDDGDILLDEDYDSSEYSDEDLYDHASTSFAPQAAPVSAVDPPQLSTTDTPPSSDLEKLNLKEGMNVVRYITVSALQGKVVVEARIYLWGPGTKICICDVDGTITKSDIMGHVMSMVGKDYTHEGICEFFDRVNHNGYKFLYLTARSVSHSAATRGYFYRINQDGKRLPDGPLMTAPARFFDALTQEVRHRSHEFKIACLEGVRRAFPESARPFYAGFGNRINDVVAYSTCGVPEHKVFIIDDQSVIHVCKVKQTYRNLSHLVNETFPALKRNHCVQQFPHRYAYAGMHSLVSDQIERDQLAATAVTSVSVAPIQVCEGSSAQASNGSSNPPSKLPSMPASPDATVNKMSWDGHEGDEHDTDANFNSYNFWRCDPRDIVTPKKPLVDISPAKAPLPTAPAKERYFGNLWGLRGNSAAPQPQPDRPSSATSRESSAGDTDPHTTSLSHTSSHLSSHRDPTVSPPLSPTPHAAPPVDVHPGATSKGWLKWMSGGGKSAPAQHATPTEGPAAQVSTSETPTAQLPR